jgi:predicted signal transduction protein with EAL and GGDEF domain
LGNGAMPVRETMAINTNSRLAAEIRIEQATGLVRTLPLLFVCNILLSLLVAAEWRHIFSVEVVAAWLTAVVVVNTPAVRHWLRFRNRPRPAAISPAWTRRTMVYAIVIGLPWAAAILAFPLSLDAVPREAVFLIVLIAGITAGCVAALAATPRVCLSYFAVVLLPLIGRYLAVGDETHILIAASMTLYAGCLFYYVLSAYQKFTDGVRAGLEKERLLVNLRDAQSRLADAMERIPEAVALFDSDERMVLCDKAFRDHFERLGGGHMRLGATFAEMLQILAYSKAVKIDPARKKPRSRPYWIGTGAPGRKITCLPAAINPSAPRSRR